jgi:hypothetical protein
MLRATPRPARGAIAKLGSKRWSDRAARKVTNAPFARVASRRARRAS